MKDIDGAKVNIFFGTNTTCMMDFTTNTTEKNCLIRKKTLHIDGAEVSDGKVIIGGRVIGVALMSDDGGTWKQVDEEGDALV